MFTDTCAGLLCCPEWDDSGSPLLMGGSSVFLLRGNSGEVRQSLAVALWMRTHTHQYRVVQSVYCPKVHLWHEHIVKLLAEVSGDSSRIFNIATELCSRICRQLAHFAPVTLWLLVHDKFIC